MDSIKEMLEGARSAKSIVANLSSARKNKALELMAQEILNSKDSILEANEHDCELAKGKISSAMLARLKLDSKGIEGLARAIYDIIALPDPLNKILGGWENHCGLKIRKISVPIGVIAMIYESRPNVTSDSAALCFKSGNVCILKGGKEALNSNKAILACLTRALARCDLPTSAICALDSRFEMEAILKENSYIDLIIPRGGESLISFISQNSTIPVIKHDKGVCHLYFHKDAGAEFIELAINAKTQKPSACNSVETILLHKDCAITAELVRALQENGVTIKAFGELADEFNLERAQSEDFYLEYNANIVNLARVEGINEAIWHINFYGSKHSDCILTRDYRASEKFVREVDSACVFVNASTRFSDGGEFGFGAEIGISTSKLHARGPMGIESLTTYKYQIFGEGQVRD